MSEFDDKIDEILGDQDDLSDIILTVRRACFFDFFEYPLRVWQGFGKLYTQDGQEWLGTMTAGGADLFKTPAIQDGRDGASGSYNMSLNIVNLPGGDTALETYEKIKAEQSRVINRKMYMFLVLFLEREGLRPNTPISFFKEFNMFSPKFSEKIEQDATGKLVKKYNVSVLCKDGNYGRANTPNRTYSDPMQKEYARQLGVTLDRGCEYVALLANRTYNAR